MKKTDFKKTDFKKTDFKKTFLMKKYSLLIIDIKNILNSKEFSFQEKKEKVFVFINKYILLLKHNLIRFQKLCFDRHDYNSLNKTASYLISFIETYNEKLFISTISETLSFYLAKLFFFYSNIFAKSRIFI